MIKKLSFMAALLFSGLAYAGNPSADLSVQIVPTSASPPLLGLYQGDGTTPRFQTWAGRYPDFVINWSFMGPGGEGSDPSQNGGYPTVIDFSILGKSHCTS